ncbi:CsbD family protein [Streptomyces meridianus]|uniref:CsbD family protein n=1 Tax=Streptomyces meridianus TaxID=2938945 RepID=A0ABT0X3G6_9ACTN|nr:CsbD family protein [Streptomyces meridianus]MCM2577086.1 CsbD family protein [Streptomyces meridianus]
MSGRKKAEAMSKQIMGKVKTTVGRTTGSKRMEAAGRAEKLQGDMSQVVQKAKEAFKR